MARSIDTIQQQEIDFLVAAAASAGLTPAIDPTQWADEDYRQLLTFAMASGMAISEQLWDAYMTDVEAIVVAAPPQTGAWFQKKMFEFQYNASDPQVLVLDATTTTYAYPTIIPTDKVIKFCAVTAGSLGTTLIKIADASTSAMSAPIIAAAQSYANVIAAPGLYYTVISLDADRFYVQADINYRGEYSAVISANVITAITNYLAGIPFNGIVDLTDLTVAIRAVAGVISVVFNNIQARANTTAYGSGTNLVFGNTVIANDWQTVAGKIIPEDTATHTLADMLNFIPA